MAREKWYVAGYEKTGESIEKTGSSVLGGRTAVWGHIRDWLEWLSQDSDRYLVLRMDSPPAVHVVQDPFK